MNFNAFLSQEINIINANLFNHNYLKKTGS